MYICRALHCATKGAFKLFVSVSAKAQIDTAYASNLYSNQYIFPPLMDTNYTSTNTTLQGLLAHECESYVGGMQQSHTDYTQTSVTGFAQRYEVKYDSVKIMGASLLLAHLSSPFYEIFGYTEIIISVWDTTLTNMIYSKSFIDGGYVDNYQLPATTLYPYMEFIFDDTLTLYNDYCVSVEYPKGCPSPGQGPMFMTLSDYACTSEDAYSDCCTPYGVCTKYKPYVRFGCEGERSWRHVDSVNNWSSPSTSYSYVARYQHNQEPGFRFYPNMNICDSVVYKAIGLCPIRALENIITGDDSTSTGGGSTSTGNDSTSTGGGDSYIATVLADEDIELYPNPADEVLNIRSDYNITEIEVIDAINRVIERWELNTRELTLDVASYKSGTYFIIIKTDKGSLTKKFIVQ